MNHFRFFRKVKVKLSLHFPLAEHHAIRVYRGSGGTVPCILLPRHYIDGNGQLYASAALPPGKEPPLSIGQEAG